MAQPAPHTETDVLAERPDCDLCKHQGKKVPASVDGATWAGPWAYMCEPCFEQHGVGLGLGRGQRIIVEL